MFFNFYLVLVPFYFLFFYFILYFLFIVYFCMDFCLLKEVGLLFPLFFSMMIKSEFSYKCVDSRKKFLGQR